MPCIYTVLRTFSLKLSKSIFCFISFSKVHIRCENWDKINIKGTTSKLINYTVDLCNGRKTTWACRTLSNQCLWWFLCESATVSSSSMLFATPLKRWLTQISTIRSDWILKSETLFDGKNVEPKTINMPTIMRREKKHQNYMKIDGVKRWLIGFDALLELSTNLYTSRKRQREKIST